MGVVLKSVSDEKVGVLVVAYNAVSTLAEVLDRLPESFRQRVQHILVCDDASSDATHLVALGYQSTSDLPLTVIRHDVNLGYGGNQKAGYRWCIDNGLELVVLLHGDGQYSPEIIETLVSPLEGGSGGAVFGSRMMVKGGARGGGMPLYKFVGNKILTYFENRLAGLSLTEWHSGYRAYRTDALRLIPFETYSDNFDFDTEIILGLHKVGKSITEVPIPTYYGDEISRVNGLKYAKDVLIHASKHRMEAVGLGGGIRTDTNEYSLKRDELSSHSVLVKWISHLQPQQVLDLGCSSGLLSAELRALGQHVTGVDIAKFDGILNNVDVFVEADLNLGVPPSVSGPFDVVVAGDVLEHLVSPHTLLASARRCLAKDGSLLVSVPNFAHWYPRLRVLTGTFDYDQRGIIDSGHVRFFTRKSFKALVERAGYQVVRSVPVGLPLSIVTTQKKTSRLKRIAVILEKLVLSVWPSMFAYQYVLELKQTKISQSESAQNFG